MTDYWVLVADQSRARLFYSDKIRTELNELETMINPDARVQESELVESERGRYVGEAGSNHRGSHAFEPATSLHKQYAQRFADELATRLEKGATERAYQRLIIVAAPEMLGLLRESLGNNSRKCLHNSVDKDLVRAKPAEILKHLSE